MSLRFRALALAAFLAMALGLGSAAASSLSGQSYALFSKYYKEGITFINENAGRHLIPLSLAKDPGGQDKRTTYSLMGDTLKVTLTMDSGGQIIESCVMILTAPGGMAYGSALYNDFAISGYQSYALLMAMHTDSDPARRYQLVTDVVEGMAASGGQYQRQLGVYTLTCTRQDNVAELRFDIKALQQTPEPDSPGPGEDLPIEPEAEGDGML